MYLKFCLTLIQVYFILMYFKNLLNDVIKNKKKKN